MSILKSYYRTIVWLLLMLYLLLSPSSGLPKSNIINLPHADKLIHAGLFGILALIYFFETFFKLDSLKIKGLHILFASILLGIVTELIQHNYIKGRNGDVYDFVADITGVILAISFYLLFGKNIFEKIRS